jgi:Ca2+-binding RTX toxin-like protein
MALAALTIVVLSTTAGCAGRASSWYVPAASVRGGDPRCVERVGTMGNDRQVGTWCDDLFFAGAGDDTQQGGGGHDTLFGGPGADIQVGDAGNDVLLGGGGKDWQSGGPGDDTILPGLGSGYVDGGPGSDTMVVDGLDWAYDATTVNWKRGSTGEAIRVESIERILDGDGAQIWP